MYPRDLLPFGVDVADEDDRRQLTVAHRLLPLRQGLEKRELLQVLPRAREFLRFFVQPLLLQDVRRLLARLKLLAA